MAEPPVYRYPVEDPANDAYNREQDLASLRDVAEKIEHWKDAKGIEIAAVVLEPI